VGDPISEKVVAALASPPRRHYFGGSKLAGAVAPAGFGVDVQPTGAKSFFLHYRREGRPFWHTLGRWTGSPKGGQLSVSAAIRVARERAEELAKPSADPRPPRTRRMEDGAAVAGKETVAQVLARYVDRQRKDRGDKFRTLDQVERALNRCVVPRIGKLAAHELRRKHVIDMLDAIADENSPIMADRVLSYFKTAWTWAADRDEELSLPFTKSMRRTKAADSIRTRILSDEEIRAVWIATEDGEPFSRLVRFLLLTAARRGEAGKLPWAEIDTDHGGWSLPAARHKVKTDLKRPLSKLALKQLVPNGELLAFDFTNGPMTRGLREVWRASGTTGWQLHDLRRSARSLMSRAHVPAEHAERCLGHKAPVIQRTYDLYGYDTEMRTACEKLAALVTTIVRPQKNVVPMRAVMPHAWPEYLTYSEMIRIVRDQHNCSREQAAEIVHDYYSSILSYTPTQIQIEHLKSTKKGTAMRCASSTAKPRTARGLVDLRNPPNKSAKMSPPRICGFRFYEAR
jgi:integrase